MSRMFGTDGVRGVANEELTPLLAMQLGQAGAYVLTRENKHKPTIMVGCDTRMSGDMLANALMAGICSVGANAVYVGVIPTPAIAYLTKKYKVEAGVVINGIKFFDGNGYKLPDALEDEIEALIKNNMNRVEFPTGSSVGRIKYRKDAREEYINHAVRAVPVDLTNLKVVVDCAEGASHYTSIEALRQLGAQVVPIHNMPDGTNINANCGSTHMEELQARVVYEKANIGLAFDGDADRLLAVDELGNVVDGDQIMAIVGAHMRNMGKLKQNTIVATAQEIHEHTRCNEDKQQTGYETVDTCCLCDGTSKKHGRSNITLALRLASDCLQRLCYCVTFTNTRSDTCDQRTSCSNCTSC